MAVSNGVILDAAIGLGLPSNARTITAFFYWEPVKAIWRAQHTVQLTDRVMPVMVPSQDEEEDTADAAVVVDEIRESIAVQAMLARIGARMGFKIWLPRNDRSRVLKAWDAKPGELLEALPLSFDSATMATIEQIDVLWVKERYVARAFEVEHTTAIYSGLLRMADLVALQPNLRFQLHIVAGIQRRDKVMREILRPVFSVLEGGALREFCSFISYDSVREIAEHTYLDYLSPKIIGAFEEFAAGDVDTGP